MNKTMRRIYRLQGKIAFFPGGDPLMESPYKVGWGHEFKTRDFVDGWREAQDAYEDEQQRIASDPDAPELTDEQIAAARPFAEVFPTSPIVTDEMAAEIDAIKTE